ncbi:MAG: hypothetical protein MUO30_12240 [Anaerolineales bacterium]|nr:hypothetical protein [Anaerolineales bacterium]
MSEETCDCAQRLLGTQHLLGKNGDCDCGCECCGGGRFHRRYQTKAEQIAELETYMAELKSEVQAVEERLADLRKG